MKVDTGPQTWIILGMLRLMWVAPPTGPESNLTTSPW
jgi:hypothetical protein